MKHLRNKIYKERILSERIDKIKNIYDIPILDIDYSNVFYVGMGRGNRCNITTNRSYEWNKYISFFNGNFNVIKVKENMTNEEAISIETYYIYTIGIDNLVNKLYGGRLNFQGHNDYYVYLHTV